MFQAQGGGLLSLRREVSVSLRAEENTLFEGLKAVGLAPARPTVENGRIQISVLDLFRDLGLIDGDARATPRMVMLVQWLADLTEAAGPPSLPARPLRARQRQADNIPGGHARILLGRPLGDADARKRRQRLRRALAWARSGEPDRNYQNINALVSVLVRCHDTSSGDDKEMTDIERACRFPLGAHYQVRQRFNTPLMWVVFPVLSYRTDPHMMGLEPRAGQRRPIGLFIGLRHQDILRPLNSRSLPALVGPLKAVASWLSVATNQDFLDTVLQKYVALSGAAFAGQAVAHIVNKPRHVSSRVLLDDGAVIQDAIVLTQDEWREITASSRTLMDLTNPAPQGTWPPFDVGQLVNETVTARQPSLTGMPIDIKVTTSGNCRILADREAVRLFVIRELLENAIRECDKYVRQLRKSRDLSGIGADSKGCIYFTIVQSVDGVCVRVENPAICDPCSRGVPVGYPRFDGVTWQGYGLMVARQVMRYFGGDLRWPPHRKEKLFKVEAYFRITQPKE
jgi:hypothetical protein